MAEEMQMQGGSNVQGIVQTILNAINNLPNSPQACEQNTSCRNNSAQPFSSRAEELNSRFQIPRTGGSNQTTVTTPHSVPRRIVSSTDFNPRQNYNFQRPGRRKSQRGSVKKDTTAPKPELFYKDICLLPNPEWNQVPRGSGKASLVERGLYVDAFQLDKNWSEARLYTELFSVFQRVLKLEDSHEIG